jgi:hypothetical protein
MLAALATAILTAVIGGTMSPAFAHPRVPNFGPAIDPYGSYEGQSKCEPAPKPGVLAFQAMVVRAYPATTLGSISRACNIGGQSEHKEGRAWDWGAAYANRAQRAAADDLIKWLLAKDTYGNDAAMARRFGIMYIIWHRRIWMPGGGWRTYCVDKKDVCRDPGSHTVLDPHVSHVHFSFTWAGAREQTSFWNPDRSMIAGLAPAPSDSGYWLLGRNGSVGSFGDAPWFGAMDGKYLPDAAQGVVSTPDGGGYWIYTSGGKVRPFGDASFRGAPKGSPVAIASMASTSKGNGYWLVSKWGRVFAYGRATSFGDLSDSRPSSPIVSIVPSASGLGYALVSALGRVYGFGDATPIEGAADVSTDVVAAAPAPTGYWLVTSSGRVVAVGGAHSLGGVAGKTAQKIVSITAMPGGAGYWLASSTGRVWAFGAARLLGYPGAR